MSNHQVQVSAYEAQIQREILLHRQDCAPAIKNILALPEALTMHDLLPASLGPETPLYKANQDNLVCLVLNAQRCIIRRYTELFQKNDSLFSSAEVYNAVALGYNAETYIYALVLDPHRSLLMSDAQRFNLPFDTFDPDLPKSRKANLTPARQMRKIFWEATNKEVFFRGSVYMEAASKALFLGAPSLNAAIQCGKDALMTLSHADVAKKFESLATLRLPTAPSLREQLMPNQLDINSSPKPH